MSKPIGDDEDVESTAAPPGWYPYPHMADTICYFDGEEWTEHVAPSKSAGGPKESHILWLGYASALLLPIVGFIVGLTQINRTRHGVYIILVSLLLPILVGIFFLVVFIAGWLSATNTGENLSGTMMNFVDQVRAE